MTKLAEENRNVVSIESKTGEPEVSKTPDALYQELIQSVQKYHPSDDISMIRKAYETASEAHKDQFRKSGEPYIIHPLNVAIILAELELDKETIIAGLLHDVVEDTAMTEEDLKREFGEDVALLVDGVTKLESIPLTSENRNQSDEKLEMQAENLRKMFLAMAKDIRVIMIKLADRLHNLRTIVRVPDPRWIQKKVKQSYTDILNPLPEAMSRIDGRYNDTIRELADKIEDQILEVQRFLNLTHS